MKSISLALYSSASHLLLVSYSLNCYCFEVVTMISTSQFSSQLISTYRADTHTFARLSANDFNRFSLCTQYTTCKNYSVSKHDTHLCLLSWMSLFASLLARWTFLRKFCGNFVFADYTNDLHAWQQKYNPVSHVKVHGLDHMSVTITHLYFATTATNTVIYNDSMNTANKVHRQPRYK